MTESDRLQRIRAQLTEVLAPEQLEVVDESHLHAGHAGARSGMGHFRVFIVSSRFAGENPPARHRLVYEALGDMMRTDIHALSIQARSPEEV